MSKVFVSWSGGKDSCLAYYKAVEAGLEVSYLVNILNQNGSHSCTHGLPASFLKSQADALGVPIIQLKTCGEKYESDLKELCLKLKLQGVDGAVFGNGDVEHHWIDRFCRDVGVTPYFPLDELTKDGVIRELVGLDFEAITITARDDVLNEFWLGQKINLDFFNRLNKLKVIMNLTRGGESGVYHTAVIDGPIFKNRIKITKSERILKDGYWYLNVLETGGSSSDQQLMMAGELSYSK